MNQPHRIFHTIKRIHHIMEQKGNLFLKDDDLTMSQAHVLLFLSHQPEHCASMKILEKNLFVAQSTSAGFVSRLEKKGFLQLLPDPNDKRVKLVQLTPNCQLFLEKMQGTIAEADRRILSAFTPEEQILFLQLLKKLENSI